MIIRQFQKSDARACCSVITACINAETSLDPQTRFYLLSQNVPSDFYNDVKDDYVLVGELYGQIVAVGALDKDRIHHIYVSPDYRGNGFGETLMVALEAEAKAHGIEIINVEVPPPAVEFYQELGYQSLNRIVTKVGYSTVEMTRMNKYLSKFAGV
ncbi:MAG: GNAT family N-acetyltransferase [Chloroflexota bacterium]